MPPPREDRPLGLCRTPRSPGRSRCDSVRLHPRDEESTVASDDLPLLVVTGGLGRVAGVLLPSLAARFRLHLVDRAAGTTSVLVDRASVGDLTNPGFTEEVTSGADAVLHLAGNAEPDVPVAGRGRKPAHHSERARGHRAVRRPEGGARELGACKRRGLPRRGTPRVDADHTTALLPLRRRQGGAGSPGTSPRRAERGTCRVPAFRAHRLVPDGARVRRHLVGRRGCRLAGRPGVEHRGGSGSITQSRVTLRAWSVDNAAEDLGWAPAHDLPVPLASLPPATSAPCPMFDLGPL